MLKRVCVIGAGPAGLASLRYLTENHGKFDVIAFEQTTEVGGIWAYKENDGTDEHGRPVHSPMYPDLVTNFPTAIMEYPGFPYPANLPSFVHNTHVRKYFEDFCQKLSLKKYIQFGSKVVEVKPILDGNRGSKKWKVTVEAMAPGTDAKTALKIYYFDVIMVCSGKYGTPRWPELKGLELFTGDVRHSMTYRHPEQYAAKRVAVIGGGPSAMDMAQTLIHHAKHVYHCRDNHRSKIWPKLDADNLTNSSGITEVKASSIVLEDGEEIEVDALLVCTGYLFSFPFLTPECRPMIEDNRISSLYKHVIHTDHPTMGFISICSFLPLIDLQARFFLASLTGKMVLPSRDEMERDVEEDYKRSLSQGVETRNYHLLFPPRVGLYILDVAATANIAPVPPYYEKILNHLFQKYCTDFTTVRHSNYTKIGDDNFEVVQALKSGEPLG